MQPLTLIRIPGPHGPVLRCQGDLTLLTAETLRRDLGFLTRARHEGVVVNVSRLTRVDSDGILALVEGSRRAEALGTRLLLVASGSTAGTLRLAGVDRVVPVCGTEGEALERLDGVLAPPAPVCWEEARDRTVARWRELEARAETAPGAELARDLTLMFALCEKADAEWHAVTAQLPRCYFCPLFYSLGGRPEDVGCTPMLDRMLECVRGDDRGGLREHVEAVIGRLETMPLPIESAGPVGAGALRKNGENQVGSAARIA